MLTSLQYIYIYIYIYIEPLETLDVLAQTLRELNIYITHDDNEELGRQARLGVWQKVFVSHTDIWRWVLFLADPTLLYWQGNGNDDECKDYSLITRTRMNRFGFLAELCLIYLCSIGPPPLSFLMYIDPTRIPSTITEQSTTATEDTIDDCANDDIDDSDNNFPPPPHNEGNNNRRDVRKGYRLSTSFLSIILLTMMLWIL